MDNYGIHTGRFRYIASGSKCPHGSGSPCSVLIGYTDSLWWGIPSLPGPGAFTNAALLGAFFSSSMVGTCFVFTVVLVPEISHEYTTGRIILHQSFHLTFSLSTLELEGTFRLFWWRFWGLSCYGWILSLSWCLSWMLPAPVNFWMLSDSFNH